MAKNVELEKEEHTPTEEIDDMKRGPSYHKGKVKTKRRKAKSGINFDLFEGSRRVPSCGNRKERTKICIE